MGFGGLQLSLYCASLMPIPSLAESFSDPAIPFNSDRMDKKIKSSKGNFDYFFVKPSRGRDVHESAKRLMEIKGVKEVAITEGDCGFVVKADFLYERENDFLYREIMKAVGGTSRKAACYCEYHK